MGHVVVLYSLDQCEQDPTTRCLMQVFGPFESNEAAKAFMAMLPEAFNAHAMILNEPGS